MAEPIDRRRFLTGAGTLAVGGWLQGGPGRSTRAWAQALARTRSTVVEVAGTTLESSIVPSGGSGYLRLVEGPAWPIVVRSELAQPLAGREDRRRPVAVVAHLTDLHIVDAQSPGRVEFLDDAGPLFTGAWRPQETLGVHVAASMVSRINSVGSGPVTGRPIDCAVSTGDNTDNAQSNELDWFIGVLDGGPVVPDSGERGTYEGTQDATDRADRYWHPGSGQQDRWKTEYGYPDVDGLLAAAIAPVASPGLAMDWYSTFGNHDGLLQGNLAASAATTQLITGARKITELPAGRDPIAFIVALATDPAAVGAEVAAGRIPTRTVTSDSARRPLTPASWVQAHLDSPKGPHGFTPDHLSGDQLYHSFDVSDRVLGLSLDTCNHHGGLDGASGSIGEGQLRWMERQIQAVSSEWLDAAGEPVRGGSGDRLVMIFSHHTSTSMGAVDPDPARPAERRVQGPELVATLLRYPNVVAWVNGHTHTNSVEPRPDPTGRTGGFWEINTASHIDYPEQARLVEVSDNADGTLSIHCTLLEHAAPAATDTSDLSLLGLASLSRELGANDPQIDRLGKLGPASARNVELLLAAPALRAGSPRPPTTSAGVPRPPAPPGTSAAPPATAARPVAAIARFTG